MFLSLQGIAKKAEAKSIARCKFCSPHRWNRRTWFLRFPLFFSDFQYPCGDFSKKWKPKIAETKFIWPFMGWQSGKKLHFYGIFTFLPTSAEMWGQNSLNFINICNTYEIHLISSISKKIAILLLFSDVFWLFTIFSWRTPITLDTKQNQQVRNIYK